MVQPSGDMSDPREERKTRAKAHVERYRRSNGAEDDTRGGHQVLLLTTTGRKSGRPFVVPLMYFPDGDRQLIVASNYGDERAPDWYRNLVAHPVVRVQIGAGEFDATARATDGEERSRLWKALIKQAPFYGRYQKNMQRQIPLVLLERQ